MSYNTQNAAMLLLTPHLPQFTMPHAKQIHGLLSVLQTVKYIKGEQYHHTIILQCDIQIEAFSS